MGAAAVPGIAADALEAWIAATGLKEGPIFRRVRGQMLAQVSPPPPSRKSCDGARHAGLQGDCAGHSLRSGFITEGGRQGVALPAVMAMTEHRSVAA